jgi:hypothetical protein
MKVGLVASLALPDHMDVSKQQESRRKQHLLEGPASGIDWLLVSTDSRKRRRCVRDEH